MVYTGVVKGGAMRLETWRRVGAALLLVGAWLLLGQAHAGGLKRALVIGNAAYRVGALPNALNDARLVSGLLRDMGYQVALMTDLDLKGMRSAVKVFGESLRADDEVFVFYVGHGFELENENYLMGVELTPKSHADVVAGALALQKVLKAVSKARVKVVVIDASRAERFTQAWRGFERHGLSGVHPLPKNTLLAFSTKPFALALASDATEPRNGPYALALQARLRQPGTIYDVFKWVEVETAKRTEGRQVPSYDANIADLYGFTDPVVFPMPPGPEPGPGGRALQALDPAAIEWVTIEGGTFEMGEDSSGERLSPKRTVAVPSFQLMRTEVTVAQYRECVVAGACSAPQEACRGCQWDMPGREAHPVVGINWFQAAAFARWAKARLPSEVEWEFAARSRGRFLAHPWGEAPASCRLAMMADEEGYGCGYGHTTAPVCSKSAGHSAQGICDLAGNVSEWVADGFGPEAEAPFDASAGPAPGKRRVARGGSWVYPGALQHVKFRHTHPAEARAMDRGMRLAR